jgi:dipeptidyl-peptidase-4
MPHSVISTAQNWMARGAERLSPANQNGTHSYSVSPTGKFAQHSFSNYYTPSSREWVTLPDHKTFNGDNVNAAVAKADKSKSNIEFFQSKNRRRR